MRLACLAAGILLTACLAASGCSSEGASPDEVGVETTAQAIQNGTVDESNTFAVGVCRGNAGNCSSICSGALILPNVVATARHCVDRSPQIIDCSKEESFGARMRGAFHVTTNTAMRGAGAGWYTVKEIAVPEDDVICGNDIALLVLEDAIPASVAKPIVPGVQYLMWDPAHYGASFTAIGYGNTSPSGGSGTRRIKNFVSVLCVPGSPMRPCPSWLSEKEFVGGDGTCSGDSGSSAYETSSFQAGQPVSFGVLSRGGESEDGTLCQGSVYTRFDAHRDFVLDVAKQASNNWELYPEPSWTEYKPPPVVEEADAGVDATTTAAEAPPKREFGEPCERTDDCSSGICVDGGDGSLICSSSCSEDDATSCPDGYECHENVCSMPFLTEAPPPAKTIKRTTTTCAATIPDRRGTSWESLAVGALFVLAAARRRRSR